MKHEPTQRLPESFPEKHSYDRTPDYIMLTILLLYFIGYPLQAYLRDTDKPRTENAGSHGGR